MRNLQRARRHGRWRHLYEEEMPEAEDEEMEIEFETDSEEDEH